MSGSLTAQEIDPDPDGDPASDVDTVAMGQMELPSPPSIEDLYVYDPITDRYIYTQTLGDFNISYPIILTPEEYQDLIIKEEMKKYFKDKISAADGRKEGSDELQKNLLPSFYVKSSLFETIFGGNVIEVIPQGSVEMDLGVLFTKQDNPAFSPRNRTNLSFDFDQRISLSLLGKVGERLSVTANYDTQSTFDFQNQIKLEYDPTLGGGEDSIIQKIEVGNVSMPLNSSLIQGAQSLFGVKTQLQFGKTTITGVFSEQKSETRSVVAEGGSTVTDYEFFASEYDENRHFFLAHYFRDNYNTALGQYPFINSNVQITRAEVWITNTTSNTDDVRNIVAIQDIGESDISNIGLDFPPGGFLNKPRASFPDNANNDFNPFGIEGDAMSILNSSIRDIATVGNGFGISVNDGTDYATLENARRLDANEYDLNTQLGYISLNQRLNNDEVLGVAFQYTVNGKVYQVGEFSTDGVDANGGDIIVDPDAEEDDLPEAAIQQNLIVKLLKSSITSVNEPVWDLMMKNIYSLGAFQLEKEDFTLNILYSNPSPINYITAAEGSMEFPAVALPEDIENTVLLRVFNLDRLNYNNDPQQGGDGFFDFYPGITVDQTNGRIIFTSVEPFGEYLFDKLEGGASGSKYDIPETYNANQNKYVYRSLYRTTKIQAEQEDSDKNLFQIKGTYKSTGSDGIAIGAFNIPQGSVTVTAGGRTLVEGVDYTVNYQLGRVQIIDPALQASNTPINISVENNTLFGQQTKRFTGLNVEHKFNENFLIGGTYLNLNERPLTQKSNYDSEPINNTIFGFNAAYSTEVPFLTRLVNKLPNIDTDVESNMSVRGEFAYLMPGSPDVSDFDGKSTSYLDDFEASQTGLDISSPLSWYLSSAPLGYGGEYENGMLEYSYKRAKLNWYSIDPIFYSTARPDGISDEDLSSPFTRRVFRDEIFPNQDIVQGQTQALFTLDLNYNPSERGQYNYNPMATADGNGNLNVLPNPGDNYGGIMRSISTTDFESSNVEYIQFWVMNPFIYDENAGNTGGTLRFNLGNISEDVLKDGRKQYENGLPDVAGETSGTTPVVYGKVPTNQALIYTFDSTGDARTAQDIGYDGFNDNEEMAQFGTFGQDPARDNYLYFLQAEGDIRSRYNNYNGSQGNSPESVGDTDRGNTSVPDVEDINRDKSMNTVNSYFEYEIPFAPGTMNAAANDYVTDFKEIDVTAPNGEIIPTEWVQFKIPISEPDRAINGITDYRSIRFMRMYLTDFTAPTTLRFGSMELVRGDYRRYTQTLDASGEDPELDDTIFEVEAVNIEENENRQPIPYVLPPGVIREELNNNNSIIRQNEQSLAMRTCGLEPEDGRAVYKNFNVDMRQYENLEMFIHAESLVDEVPLADGDMVAFMRIGNDLSENFYEIQIPLNPTSFGAATDEDIWPAANRLNLRLSLLQDIKTKVLDPDTALPTATSDGVIFYNESELLDGTIAGENELRIGIKGSPSFGNVRIIMLGLKNGSTSNSDVCGEVWFNELRLSELKNTGGWAAVASLDANVADFANVSATANKSTIGFGSVDQGPNARSMEDSEGYDLVTNLNLGQMLPKKWGVQLPFNYGRSVETITPQYDPEYQDIELQDRLDNTVDASERDRILEQSIDYTKRESVNLIGIRKERTGDAAPKVYDVENFTFSGSYNQMDHHSFEIEESFEQVVRAGATYNYNFEAKTLEPFKKNDSLFTSKYLQFLKDVNLNYLPSNINLGSNITRKYNEIKYREVGLDENFLAAPKLYQRNYLFDWNYGVNWNLTKSFRFNFTAANNRIVTNYLNPEEQEDGSLEFVSDNSIGVWDGFFDVGDPNLHQQQLELNYDLPFDKLAFLKFIRATYSYTGTFQWQGGSDLFNQIDIVLSDGTSGTYNLGNSVQNSSAHRINSNLDFNSFYRSVGLTKKRANRTGAGSGSGLKGGSAIKGGRAGITSKAGSDAEGGGRNSGAEAGTGLSAGDKATNTLIGLATMIKKVQLNYTQNEGTYLPGYTPTIGFAGTLKPTTGFTFGSQLDVREEAARKGWLTLYPEFNEQYTETDSRQLDVQANLEPLNDLKIDLNANRTYSENYSENYIVTDNLYNTLTPNTFGNFNISTFLLKTAFGKSDENGSVPFDDFRSNRLVVANKLATDFYGTSDFPVDEEGYPVGFGKTSQDVLLPAFLAAYKGSDADSEDTGFLRDVPLPNWDIKYTGLMKLDWFKKNFKRFSLQHGYQAGYTVNQFQTNLDYNRQDPTETDQSGNFKSEMFLTNVNLTEQFSPLIRVDFEMKNSVKILAELRKDRALSLSFANNLLTEIIGNEVILGLGYRVKDLRFVTNLGGKRQVIKSDLNFKLDGSVRNNKTIIRYLDLNNNQVTAGQTIYGLQFSADYALSKNLTALFYYDHTFSEYAISTAFPQTTIRSGITLRYNFGN
ncbi:gliding motility-related protein [unidentified eubacterium SCB49]|nr:gliding motility-related protein [unidentified eubacterium SCB49]